MKKGMAMEGYMMPDGTVKPLEKYDDTELRAKIQANKDDIDNLDSRVEYLEEHGGAEDQTKADKVENATAGNLASLDEEGNLHDSGYEPSDFAPATGSTAYAPSAHSHSAIFDGESNGIGVDGINGEINIEVFDGENGGEAAITPQNIGNLDRILQNSAVVMEAHSDTAGGFDDSDVIGTIINDGIRLVHYHPTTSHPDKFYILIVQHKIAKPSAMASNKYIVTQILVTEDGILKRHRAYNLENGERGDAYDNWSEWTNIVPSVTGTITENGTDPVTAGAVYSVVNQKISYTAHGMTILKDTVGSVTYPLTDERLQEDVSDFVLHVPVGKVVVCHISYGTQLSQLNNALCLVRWSEATGSNVFIEVYLGSSLFVALLPYSGEHVIDFTSAAWTKVDLSSF